MTLTPKEEAVLDLIQKDTAYANYFFRKVSDDVIKWFFPLKGKGFFATEKAPSPEPAGQEGLFRIPEWNVLPYLEKISKKVSEPRNERYIDELLTIIKDVSNYKDKNGRHIDNYRTWHYFIKILVNLPTEKITSEVIDLIPIWLDSKFTTTLPGSEVSLKLLPKFLNSNNPEDWKKSERIIEIITDIKWVPLPEKQRSILEREQEEVLTLVESHWLKKTFKKYGDQISKVCSIDVINTIAKRLLNILGRKHSHSCDVKYDGRDYLVTHMLNESGSHRLLLYSLNYPKEWDGFSREKIEKSLVLSADIAEFKTREEFSEKIKEILVEKFPKLTTEPDEELSSIYYLRDYSYIWYKSLGTSTDESYLYDTEGLLTCILKELLSAKSHYDSEGTGKLLRQFLSNEYPYPLFKRLVLFLASLEWDQYKEHFLQLIQSEEMHCFDDLYYETELSDLLKVNFNKFGSDVKAIIKKIILEGPQFVSPENPEPEKYKAYWKQKWLFLLKDEPDFARLYEEQKGITGIEKIDWGRELEAPSGVDASPLTVEEMLRLSNADLASRMKDFKSEKTWGGKTIDGFSTTLKDAVKIDPNKFTDNMKPFADVGFIYIYKILDGLKDAWVEKKVINWGKVFEFIEAYIKKEQFWSDEFIVEKGEWRGGADHEWVVNMIAYLIQEGTRDGSWAFPEDYFEKAREIIFLLLKEHGEDKDISDYVSHALNTPCGNLIQALVYLALRIARVDAKKEIKTGPKWSDEFRNKFDELLNSKIVEAYTYLGRFFPYLNYLDNKWVRDKVERISSEKGSKYWEAFMDGYLSIGKVYEDIYDLMRSHYEFGLSYNFKGERNREHLIQHISVAYLIGQEDLSGKESLFKKIIDKWNPEEIREIIEFFRLQGYKDKDEKKALKIMVFWRRVYRRYESISEDALTTADKRVLSDISNLAAFLTEIDDESYGWLKLSAAYLNEGYNAHAFIEHLDELKNRGEQARTARYIGGIYLKMLEKVTPDYDQAHIRSIVEFIYQAGEKVNASEICNIYEREGHEFLRGIYITYSSKS